MVSFQTFENTSKIDLLETFNRSFSDYIVPLCLTNDQLESKIKSDRIDLELSVGAFENDKLIGFILHGFDAINGQNVVYNAATGVVPEKRGDKLTAKMYEYILPLIKARNVHKMQLEVITENVPAIKTYENLGFKVDRTLNCYKGTIGYENSASQYEIYYLKNYDWEKLRFIYNLPARNF